MKWNTLDRHVKYLYANWCNTAGGGPAESNLKFDNALLRAVVHSPGSRELCREGSDVLPRVYHVQKPYCRWYILCGPSCVYISRPYRQFSWRERLLARLISLWPPIIICTRANPSVSGMCNYFVTPFRRTRYACTRGNLGLHGNIDMIFFLRNEYHLYDFLLIFWM